MSLLDEINQIQASLDRMRLMITLPPKSQGIDVSHWQGVIDWNAVKTSGVVFAFIKATESTNFSDPSFAVNWRNAKTAGVLRGAYHFYRFATEPIAQANYFVSRLGGDIGELQPVLDAEDTNTPAHADDMRVFCERVFALTGKRCIIYTGNWWWTPTRLGGAQPWVKDYPLWIAAYIKIPVIPKDWSTWTFWQYTSSGKVAGINGNVDLDIYQ